MLGKDIVVQPPDRLHDTPPVLVSTQSSFPAPATATRLVGQAAEVMGAAPALLPQHSKFPDEVTAQLVEPTETLDHAGAALKLAGALGSELA